jgi:hypothetical protein
VHGFANMTNRCGAALLATALIASGGCASRKVDVAQESISARAPFSRTFPGPSDAVCWSVKRALLSQGYMLDRPAESGVLTGTRDFQPESKLNVSFHLQTTCADNRDGTSIVFVTVRTRGQSGHEAQQPHCHRGRDDLGYGIVGGLR